MNINIKENQALKSYNTFGVEANAAKFFAFKQEEELVEFIKNVRVEQPLFILGGGSNVLFVNDFNGLIIHPENKGINILEDTEVCSVIEVAAGEVWDDFVLWAVENNYYGIENLSGIPGSVGATPVQNIGAYGDEVKNCIKLVKGIDIETGEQVSFLNFQCQFGYRNSIFKNELKNKVIITSVIFSLSKIKNFNLSYADISNYFKNTDDISLKKMREAVLKIRDNKLPDPKIIGNGGSFFKNPIILKSELEKLLENHPEIRYYNYTSQHVKLAAGWLIDNCGLKGYKKGRAGVHENQALVLVNLGSATGQEVLDVANEVKSKVFEKFCVELECEVNVLA